MKKSSNPSRKELLAAIKEHISLTHYRQKLKKMYPAGTCNAEDAWRDFGKWEEKVETNLRRLAKTKIKKTK